MCDMIHLFVACPQAYLHDSLSKDLTFQQDDGNVTFIASRPMALALFLNGCAEQVLGVGEAQMKTPSPSGKNRLDQNHFHTMPLRVHSTLTQMRFSTLVSTHC